MIHLSTCSYHQPPCWSRTRNTPFLQCAVRRQHGDASMEEDMLGQFDPGELEQLQQMMGLLEGYQGQFGAMPPDLQELVQRVKGQQPAAAQDKVQEVTPQPGYVIKTTDQDGRKVFINMCHSEHVPAPSSWAQGMAPDKVMQALEDLQANNPNADAEAMRFALSCSELQPDTDKQGQACVSVDCMLNSGVMAAAQQHRPLKAFVNELALDWVGQKHGLALSPQYKLPKIVYKGTEVRPQRVRAEPRQLVADVTGGGGAGGGAADDDGDAPSFPLLPAKAGSKARGAGKAGAAAAAAAGAGASAAAAGAGGRSGQQPPPGPCWQHEVTCQGRPVTDMVVAVQLPARCSISSSGSGSGAWSPGDVRVEVSGMRLRVTLAGQLAPDKQQEQVCCMQLPFAADPKGARAQLEAGSGRLAVHLRYMPVAAWAAAVAADAPQAFAALPVAHDAYMELE